MTENAVKTCTTDEIWKEIKGFKGLYSVSSHGRVKSLKRTIVMKNGQKRTYKEKILKQKIAAGTGYLCVNLSEKCIVYPKSIHRLVAETFVPNPLKLNVVMHLDNNKLNNNANNLKWGTFSENSTQSVTDNRHRNSKKTHCPRNHEYTKSNTLTVKLESGRSFRQCKICQKISQSKIRAKRKIS